MSVFHYNTEFPYEEIYQPDGNLFCSVQQAIDAGFNLNQIWSVTIGDHTMCFGPSHHWVNLLGYLATKETHDGETYYEEDCLTFEGEDS